MADRAVETGPEGFADLVLGGGPLLDVRAEIEFNRGAFPGSVNLPILKTNEREQVGLCYKNMDRRPPLNLGNTPGCRPDPYCVSMPGAPWPSDTPICICIAGAAAYVRVWPNNGWPSAGYQVPRIAADLRHCAVSCCSRSTKTQGPRLCFVSAAVPGP